MLVARRVTLYPLVNDHIAAWNIPIFNRKYIFNPGPFSVAMLVSWSVAASVSILLPASFCRKKTFANFAAKKLHACGSIVLHGAYVKRIEVRLVGLKNLLDLLMALRKHGKP